MGVNIGNLFLQGSGGSGFQDFGNTGDAWPSPRIAISGSRMGVGTNVVHEKHKLTVYETGEIASLGIQHGAQPREGLQYQAILPFIDNVGNEAGLIGFNENNSYDFSIYNFNQTGGIHFDLGNVHHGISRDQTVASFQKFTTPGSGIERWHARFGINTLEPDAKIHVVQDYTGEDPGIRSNVALFHVTGHRDAPEFVVKGDGKVGINWEDPPYTLSVSGHYESFSGVGSNQATQTGAFGTIYAQQYVFQNSGFDTRYATDKKIITVDFNGPTFRTIILTGCGDGCYQDSTFTTTNGSAAWGEVKAVALRLIASGGARLFNTDSRIEILGLKPTGLASGHVGILSLNSFGKDVADTVGVWRSSDELSQMGPAGPMGISIAGQPGEEFRNKLIGGDFDLNPWQRLLPGQSGFYNVRSGQYTADRFAFIKSGEEHHMDYEKDEPGLWPKDLQFDVYRITGLPTGGTAVGFGLPGWSSGVVPSETGWQYGLSNQMNFPIETSMLIVNRSGVTDFANPINSGKFAAIETRIEGYDTRDIIMDEFNLTFFVKSSHAGYSTVYLKNEAENLTYIQPYEICEGEIWKKISLNFLPRTGITIRDQIDGWGYPRSSLGGVAAEAPSTGFNFGDGVGLRVGWTLACGQGLFCPEKLSGVWTTGNFYGWSGHTSGFNYASGAVLHETVGTDDEIDMILNNTYRNGTPQREGNYLFITQPMLSKGWVRDPLFQPRSKSHETHLCKRYFERLDLGSGQSLGIGMSKGNNPPVGTGINIKYEVEKRVIPTISGSGVFATSSPAWDKGGIVNIKNGIASKDSATIGFIGNNEDMSFANGNAVGLWASGQYGNYIFVDAELGHREVDG